MCGIAGIFDPRGLRASDVELTHSMVDCFLYRGPDEDGYMLDRCVSAGMRRLSIIDLSTGRQPLYGETEDITMVYNGEIYNYLEIRNRLEQKGHHFRTGSDGEVIPHLYEEQGIQGLKELNGMFAIFLWDRKKQLGYIVRDRLGIKPIYIRYEENGRIRFSSELKSLLIGQSPALNKVALAQYLTFMFIPGPATAFENIFKIQPGEVVEISPKGVRQWLFWDVPPASTDQPIPTREEFLALAEDSVRIEMRSDVTVGLFLSGGIDSSLVASQIHRCVGPGMKAFTIRYEGDPNPENEQASRIAKDFGFEHFSVQASWNELERVLPSIVWHMDEPHADSAILGTYLVSQAAAAHVKVVLNGAGGDEIFAGYHRHIRSWKKQAWLHLPSPLKKIVYEAVGFTSSARDRQHSLWRNWDKDTHFLRALATFQPQEITPLLPSAAVNPQDIYKELAGYLERYPSDPVNRLLYADLKFYLPDDVLHLTDRMSMAHSIEARVPLLDHRLVELGFRIPGEKKIPDGQMKGLMKHWLKGVLPEEILFTPKRGFNAPVDFWLSKGLDSIGLELMQTSSKERPDLTWGIQEQNWKQVWSLLNGEQKFRLLVLEIWARIFLEGASPRSSLSQLLARN